METYKIYEIKKNIKKYKIVPEMFDIKMIKSWESEYETLLDPTNFAYFLYDRFENHYELLKSKANVNEIVISGRLSGKNERLE